MPALDKRQLLCLRLLGAGVAAVCIALSIRLAINCETELQLIESVAVICSWTFLSVGVLGVLLDPHGRYCSSIRAHLWAGRFVQLSIATGLVQMLKFGGVECHPVGFRVLQACLQGIWLLQQMVLAFLMVCRLDVMARPWAHATIARALWFTMMAFFVITLATLRFGGGRLLVVILTFFSCWSYSAFNVFVAYSFATAALDARREALCADVRTPTGRVHSANSRRASGLMGWSVAAIAMSSVTSALQALTYVVLHLYTLGPQGRVTNICKAWVSFLD